MQRGEELPTSSEARIAMTRPAGPRQVVIERVYPAPVPKYGLAVHLDCLGSLEGRVLGATGPEQTQIGALPVKPVD